MTVLNLESISAQKDSAEANSPEAEQPAAERLVSQEPQPSQALPLVLPRPLPPQPAEPQPIPPALTDPPPIELPAAPSIPPNVARPAPPARPAYGPPDKGGSPALRDSERVGTAPNGEPLYAPTWYREPTPDQLRAYLSTARAPGWGLIACRTAPDYRVEDCVALEEYPYGSQINRAVLAAAWEFRVRPPRVGGRSLVGSWVRIRIDYGMERH